MIIPDTTEIEYVYGLADLFLLSSRLDPLPNVAIDAMSQSIPVLCFDKATGIADLLFEAGLGNYCVASYLDTESMAQKIVALMLNDAAYRQVQHKTKDFASRTFQFRRYVQCIERYALSARSAAQEQNRDINTIVQAGSLRPDFMLPHAYRKRTGRAVAEFYVRDNPTEDSFRKPEPGFHPTRFWKMLATNEENTSEGVLGDSYAEFLRRGRPAGPWMTKVIREVDAVRDRPRPMKVALHIHAYYPDELSKITERLKCNLSRPDLFISVADNRGYEIVTTLLKDYSGRVAAVRVVENRGRDIGPFLTTFGTELIRDYQVIGHIHTKKSEALGDPEMVDRWTFFLYENMLGGARGGAMLDRIMDAFAEDQKLGIVYADDPYVMSWSSNEAVAHKLAARLGMNSLPEAINFPVGTMFWIRNQALAPFVNLGLGWDDYPEEPVPYDGTTLHALERLFGVVPESLGLSTAVTNISGVSR